MIIELFVLSVIVGLIRRGSIKNIGRIPLRHTNLFLISFVMLAFVCWVAFSDLRHIPALITVVKAVDVLQFMVLFAATLLNMRIYGMWIASLGVLSQLLVFIANAGVMPVSLNALQITGLAHVLTDEKIRHIAMTPGTHLNLLADVIPIPVPYINQVVSIGDLMVALAVFVIIQHYMCSYKAKSEVCTAGA